MKLISFNRRVLIQELPFLRQGQALSNKWRQLTWTMDFDLVLEDEIWIHEVQL